MQIGWNVLIETTNGNVGLWTCWLGNRFSLFYPLDVEIPDQVIMDTLGVTLGEPVKNELFGTRLWEKYYSEKLEKGGRVWIGQTNSHSYGFNLYSIKKKKPFSYYFGHDRSNTIYTNLFSHYNDNEPDAPNAEIENIMPYKNKFIELLVKISKLTGDIKAINFESGPVLYTPQKLEKLGYKVEYSPFSYYSDSKRYCYTKDEENNIEIALLQGNPIVPWSTIIRKNITGKELTAENLKTFINSFNKFEGQYNVIPLFATLCQYYG